MKLQEAANLFKSDIDKWVTYYAACQKEQGVEDWPEDMKEEDWFEQFLFFCTTSENTGGLSYEF